MADRWERPDENPTNKVASRRDGLMIGAVVDVKKEIRVHRLRHRLIEARSRRRTRISVFDHCCGLIYLASKAREESRNEKPDESCGQSLVCCLFCYMCQVGAIRNEHFVRMSFCHLNTPKAALPLHWVNQHGCDGATGVVKRVCMQGDSLCPTGPSDHQPTPAVWRDLCLQLGT